MIGPFDLNAIALGAAVIAALDFALEERWRLTAMTIALAAMSVAFILAGR